MLTELRVENLGIVEDLTLTLPGGLVVITGETGAGKTLIVDALGLLVGGRADPSIVRTGAEQARVEGRFVAARGSGDEAEHVLTRVIPAEGRSRAYIDGRLATAGELSAVGAELVDLHGQHAHQSLLAPKTQRALLDAAAGAEATRALAEYRAAREAIAEIDTSLEALGGDPQRLAREVELTRYQLDEIDAAEVADADEDARLGSEIDRLADAETHREVLSEALSRLANEGREAVGEASSTLRDRAGFTEIAARLAVVDAELADVVAEVRTALDAAEADPGRLEELQQRRAILADLRRKYGPTLADVLAFADQARTRLEDLTSLDDRRDELMRRRVARTESMQAAARRLHDARAAAAGPLAQSVGQHLEELAMARARVEIDVHEDEPGDDGCDRVEFTFAANPGEAPRPLAKVASGGELARVMLALRVVLTQGPPTLVFDEVDAGIGGEAGSAVGRLLGRVGTSHQVLCVTHLAQVAAFADAQVAVAKHTDAERTVANVTALDDAGRVAELSRMLAGVGESRHAREHASELLEAARRS